MSSGNVPGPLYAEYYPVSTSARFRIFPLGSWPGCFTILSSTTPIKARLEVDPDFSFSCILCPQAQRSILPVIPPLANIPLPSTGAIGVFAQIITAGVFRIICMGQASTDNGGVRLTFKARPDALWYQVAFLGDNTATTAVYYYILRH